MVPATNGMVLPLVMRGVGLGFLPEPMVAEELSRGSIYKIPLAEDIPDRSICVVHRPHKAQKPVRHGVLRLPHRELRLKMRFSPQVFIDRP